MSEYKRINQLLAAQIQAAKERDNKLEYQAERINKQLYNKTANFSLSDWAKVRKGDFWKISDALNEFGQKRFLLKRVNQFLKSKT